MILLHAVCYNVTMNRAQGQSKPLIYLLIDESQS